MFFADRAPTAGQFIQRIGLRPSAGNAAQGGRQDGAEDFQKNRRAGKPATPGDARRTTRRISRRSARRVGADHTRLSGLSRGGPANRSRRNDLKAFYKECMVENFDNHKFRAEGLDGPSRSTPPKHSTPKSPCSPTSTPKAAVRHPMRNTAIPCA